MIIAVAENIKENNPNITNNSLLHVVVTDTELRGPLAANNNYLQNIKDITVERWTQLERVLQSNEEYRGSNTTITVDIQWPKKLEQCLEV